MKALHYFVAKFSPFICVQLLSFQSLRQTSVVTQSSRFPFGYNFLQNLDKNDVFIFMVVKTYIASMALYPVVQWESI